MSRAPWAVLMFGVACVLFLFAEIDLWRRNGYWLDEYFSIWASDPHTSFFVLFSKRIFPDTNPPLYVSALALVRPFFGEPRIAFITLNLIAFALAALFIMRGARRANMMAVGLGCLAFFLASGPAFNYAPEGRSYFAAMSLTLAIAWRVALAIETGADKRALFVFAALGALSAVTHVFAALFAASMAAGLLCEGLFKRRYELVRAGLALGAGAAFVLALWAVSALRFVGNMNFVVFTAQAVRDAIWYVRALTVGQNVVALGFAVFFGLSALLAPMRPHLRVFGIAAAAFILIPMLVSVRMPIIIGRYWLIGAPALDVLAVFALRAQILAARPLTIASPRLHLASLTLGALCIAASIGLGFRTAQMLTETKPIWRSVDVVRDGIHGCPIGSVHVPKWANLYAAAVGAPDDFFAGADQSGTPVIAAATGSCPVLGWEEHWAANVRPLSAVSDQELLSELKIAGAPGRDVQILRHSSGFVVLRTH